MAGRHASRSWTAARPAPPEIAPTTRPCSASGHTRRASAHCPRPPRSVWSPVPVPHLGKVFAMFRDVALVTLHRLIEILGRPIDQVPEMGHPKHHIEHQPEPIHAIEDYHVEGRGRGPFFQVPSNVDVVVVPPA